MSSGEPSHIKSNKAAKLGLKRRRRLSGVCSFLTVLMIVISGFLAYRVYETEKHLYERVEIREKSIRLADELRQSSDDLTRLVRTYVVTGEERYRRQFQTVLDIRNGVKPRPAQYNNVYWDLYALGMPNENAIRGALVSLQTLIQQTGISDTEKELLRQSHANSDALVNLENVAFRAVAGEATPEDEAYRRPGETHRDMAIRILHSPEYHQAKINIMQPIHQYIKSIDDRTAHDIRRLHEEERSQGVAFIAFAVSTVLFGVTSAILNFTIFRTEQGFLNREIARQTYELRRAKEEAVQANKAKSLFLATTSHELRTPLTAVLGFTELLQEQELNASARDNVEQIYRSTRSLLSIINDILDLSKLDAGKLTLHETEFDLRDLLHDVGDMFSHLHRHNDDLDWCVYIDEEVPHILKSDLIRLRQVLLNLVGNAFKFTKQGEIRLSCVKTRNDAGKAFLRFEISDTGIGISDDILPNLFHDFTQADTSTSRQYEGAGLGLAICKRLLGLMGGEIDVSSQAGKGTLFWFTIPLRDAPPSPPLESPKRKASDYKAVRPLKILFAEDNKVNQVLVQRFLGAYGHDVDVVDNGLNAVQAHQHKNYDLILMDIRMPEMDGVNATRCIRALEGPKSNIPILAATADAVPTNVDNFFSAGMDGFLSKPFDWPFVVEEINRVLNERVHILINDTSE